MLNKRTVFVPNTYVCFQMQSRPKISIRGLYFGTSQRNKTRNILL